MRFWAKVDKAGPVHPTCGRCWIWTAAKFGNGRGHFYVGGGRHAAAHVFSLELKLGRRLAGGMNALHHCDTPLCVNPDHLWEGTQRENVKDMMAKGRGVGQLTSESVRGEGNAKAKVDENAVKRIRKMCAAGVKQKDVGKMFGLTQGVVSKIVRRVCWRHVR